MEEEVAIDILREVKEVLDKYGIEFWLQSGVLLGAVRDKKFITWDSDIDLGTWGENIPKMKILAREFCDRGFETYFSPYLNSMAIKKKDIHVQLAFWRLSNDKAIMPLQYNENLLGVFLFNAGWILLFSHCGEVTSETLNTNIKKAKFIIVKLTDMLPELFRLRLSQLLHKIAKRTGNRRGLVVTPSHYFMNLSDMNFYEMKFKVPAETEDYLAYYYGEDWRTPKRDWTYVRKDRLLISKTERVGEEWKYLKLSEICGKFLE